MLTKKRDRPYDIVSKNIGLFMRNNQAIHFFERLNKTSKK